MDLILAPGRILLEKKEQDETVTKKGIIILRGTRTSLIDAKVIAVGPGVEGREMPVKPGDLIYFKKGSEMEIEHADKKFWMIDWNSYLMYKPC